MATMNTAYCGTVKIYRYSDRCCNIVSTRRRVLVPVLVVRLLSLFSINKKVYPLFSDSIRKRGLCNQILLIDKRIIENHIRVRSITKIKANEKNIIFIDDAACRVYRLSFHAGMDYIRKNFESLRNVRSISAPEPISLHVEDDFAVSIESLVPGPVMPIQEFDYDALFNKLVPALAAQYRATKMQTDRMDWSSFIQHRHRDDAYAELERKIAFSNNAGPVSLAVIHGDLTWRNILICNGMFSFIDFDRSEEGFPEHDLFLLYFDYLFHKSGVARYEKLITIIIDDLLKTKKYIEISDRFYSLVPEFSVNRNNIENIMRLFLMRTLNNIYQDHAMNPDIDMGFISTVNSTIGGPL